MFEDLTNQKFGRLIAKERIGKKWRCTCDCGKEKEALPSNLKRGLTKSCGCLNIELVVARGHQNKTHGRSHTPEHRAWQGIHQRCYNENDKSYKDYGARGITVCTRWDDFENFFEDMGKKPTSSHSLDRINNEGNYEPDNCRWATATQQGRNKRNNVVVDGAGTRLADLIEQGTSSREYQRALRRFRLGASI